MDWLAGVLELLGKWVVGNKNKWGHVINISCCIVWIIYVFWQQTAYGLLIVVIPAIIINIRNFIKWNKEEKNVRK